MENRPFTQEHDAVASKYFKEPTRSKAEKLGAQHVKCSVLLQKIKEPRAFFLRHHSYQAPVRQQP